MNKKFLCLILARGNSSRLKNKNILNFLGKPLIYYTIKAVQNSNIFSKIMVSTDNKKIAELSKKYGAEVPFYDQKNYPQKILKHKMQ